MVKKVDKSKSSKLCFVSLYLDNHDWELTDKIASKNNRSKAYLVRKWIREGIEREKKRG